MSTINLIVRNKRLLIILGIVGLLLASPFIFATFYNSVILKKPLNVQETIDKVSVEKSETPKGVNAAIAAITISPPSASDLQIKINKDYADWQKTDDKKYIVSGLETLSQASTLVSEDSGLLYSKALFYFTLVKTEEDAQKQQEYLQLATQAINDSVRLKPDDPDAQVMKGFLLQLVGQKEEAKKLYQYVLENLDPNNADAKWHLKEVQ